MFVASKVLGWLTDPFNLFLAMQIVACLLLFTRRRSWLGRRLLAALLGVAVAAAVVPADQWALAQLENRFPPAPLPERVDGIVVLGGGLDPAGSAARGMVSLNGAAERLTEMVALARRHPEARLVYSGGSGSVLDQRHKEAAYARRFYDEIGFDTGRVVFEDQSRNTRENAVFTKRLVGPRPGETWVLVTSASHMPRAMGCFRAVGWEMVPYPVDYQTPGPLTPGPGLRFSLGAGLRGWEAVLHEWAGLLAYRLAHWTDSLFPGPIE